MIRFAAFLHVTVLSNQTETKRAFFFHVCAHRHHFVNLAHTVSSMSANFLQIFISFIDVDSVVEQCFQELVIDSLCL